MEIALLSSIVELGDPDGWDPALCSPPLDPDDFEALERAGVLLSLAGAIEERRLPGRAVPAACSVRGRSFVLAETGMRLGEAELLPLPIPRDFEATPPEAHMEIYNQRPAGARLFIDAIVGGFQPEPGFAEGLAVQRVIDAALVSHRERRWVDL